MITQDWILDSARPHLKREAEAALQIAKQRELELGLTYKPHPTMSKTLISVKPNQKELSWSERVRLEIIKQKNQNK